MKYIDQLIGRHPSLLVCKAEIETAARVLIESFERGGKLLIAGNGGSAADSGHISAELLKGFVKKRQGEIERDIIDAAKRVDSETGAYLDGTLQGALPVIALTNNTALMTATLNDVDGNVMFAQQVHSYGSAGDVFLGISTSGNAKNVVCAAVLARAKGLKVVALTGKGGGRLKQFADVCVAVPQTETYLVQELHLPVYHALCLEIEEYFWEK